MTECQDKTYELKISYKPTSPRVKALEDREYFKAWLSGIGIEEFVDGSSQDLWLDPDYEDGSVHLSQIEKYVESEPIIVYRYDKEELVSLKKQIDDEFPDSWNGSLGELVTTDWQDGWKDSFKPILTRKFAILPPWDADGDYDQLLKLEIEPGMAFGTGQHATTLLCVKYIEENFTERSSLESVLDLGCGSGILSLALGRLGFSNVEGVDICSDSIRASKDNADRNGFISGYDFHIGSIEVSKKPSYSVIIANILASVLQPMLPKIAEKMTKGGVFLVSGVLEEQAEEFILKASLNGFLHKNTTPLEGWVAMDFEYKGAAE